MPHSVAIIALIFPSHPLNRKLFEDQDCLSSVNAQSSNKCWAYRGLSALLSEQNECMNSSREVCRLSQVMTCWRWGGLGSCCLPSFGETSMSSSFRYFKVRAFRRKYPVGALKSARGDRAAKVRLPFQVII